MVFNMPPNNYDEYLRSVTESSCRSLHFAETVMGMALVTSIYTICQGIIPFFNKHN